MNKISTTTLRIVFAHLISFLTSNAQNPDMGFESWKFMGPYQDPQGWVSSNLVSTFYNTTTTSKTTDRYMGSFALKLETKAVKHNIGGEEMTDTIEGSVYSGNLPLFDDAVFGYPFTSRPNAFSGYYKFSSLGADSARVVVIFKKWNADNQSADIVGAAETQLFKNTSTYTKFEAPLYYELDVNPDSAFIYLSSSSEVPLPGSTLIIDALSFDMPLGTTLTLSSEDAVKLFPQPSTGDFTFSNLPSQAEEITIYGSEGSTVKAFKTNGFEQIHIQENFASGIYIYQVKDSEGNVIYKNHLSIIK